MCFFIERYWNKEVQRAAKDLRSTSLAKVLVRCYWRSYLLIGMYIFIEVWCNHITPQKHFYNDIMLLLLLCMYYVLLCILLVWLCCRHLHFSHWPYCASSSLLLPCPTSWHEGSCGSVSHGVSQGQPWRHLKVLCFRDLGNWFLGLFFFTLLRLCALTTQHYPKLPQDKLWTSYPTMLTNLMRYLSI